MHKRLYSIISCQIQFQSTFSFGKKLFLFFITFFTSKRVDSKSRRQNLLTEYLSSVKASKISLRAESQGFTLKFKKFYEKNNINLILCTVERLIYTIKAKFIAMSFNESKPTLNAAIDKIIWNLHSTKQSSIGCSPFSNCFKKSPNTFWKSLVSHAINLDKGKSILSRKKSHL